MNLSHLPHGLRTLQFDNSFVRELPADPGTGSHRRQVRQALYSRIDPVAAADPQLLAWSQEQAEELGFADNDIHSAAFARVFAGNQLLPGMEPHATCYGGHQFGNWAGQLGDGRAINLGEVVTDSGQRLTLQLKGAGPTPYSRSADGFAVLRSSLREFLCSEAMFHLGVPTTRALSLVTTGDQVVRDMLYDGHAALEPGAVVCRVAPSFTRFGHFQMLAAREEIPLLRDFLDYTVRQNFPHLLEQHEAGSGSLALAWMAEVCELTAQMIADWMRVGFVHGVMNTDNMSVLGLTIDYGPYGWLDDYDPDWTPNTTDAAGRRYRYGYQPAVAQWNLLQLANAIFPLIGQAEPLETLLREFESDYTRSWQRVMAAKLGFERFDTQTDEALVAELEQVLRSIETDMTLFYRGLAELTPDDLADEARLLEPLLDAYYAPELITGQVRRDIVAWLKKYLLRGARDGQTQTEKRRRMNAVNPLYVPRNYLAQQAIDAAEQGDGSRLEELLEVLRRPYDEQPGREAYALKRPDWARTRVGCSQLSCSS